MSYVREAKRVISEFLSQNDVSFDEELINKKVDFLIDNYCEAFRKYHNLSHVFWMLQNQNVMEADSPILNMAILYHDVIYRVGAKDNEERSVKAFLEEYNEIIPEGNLKGVCDLIMSTNKTPWDELTKLEKILVDADWNDYMDISSAKKHTYSIRAEVISSGFTEEEFNKGLYAFLNGICEKYYEKNKGDIRLKNIKEILELQYNTSQHEY